MSPGIKAWLQVTYDRLLKSEVIRSGKNGEVTFTGKSMMRIDGRTQTLAQWCAEATGKRRPVPPGQKDEGEPTILETRPYSPEEQAAADAEQADFARVLAPFGIGPVAGSPTAPDQPPASKIIVPGRAGFSMGSMLKPPSRRR